MRYFNVFFFFLVVPAATPAVVAIVVFAAVYILCPYTYYIHVTRNRHINAYTHIKIQI